ncbi:MAG: glycosyltransferase family 4 protein [Leptolyngbyaceae cyanobacterium]
MKWSVIADFFSQRHIDNNLWLNRCISEDKYSFQLLARSKPARSWHERTERLTPISEWFIHWKHATKALNSDSEGVITVFPQLPASVGLQKLLTRSKKPVVAWTFNVGNYKGGPVLGTIRRLLAQLSLSQVDRFVVHTSPEIEIYSKWLNLPESRFEFVPFPFSDIEVQYQEETENPFIAAIGSAHRDFPTLFKVVEDLELPLVVASGRPALAHLKIPKQVQTPFDISKADCHRIAQQARINVIPLQPKEDVTAAGQVTVIEGMHMGRAMIVSDCYGMRDYITHGENGWLVKPGCIDSLREAIELLWNDEELRNRIGRNAQAYARANFSDQFAARELERILDELSDHTSAEQNAVSSALAQT